MNQDKEYRKPVACRSLKTGTKPIFLTFMKTVRVNII